MCIRILRPFAVGLAVVALTTTSTAPALAQYFYLDVDGNGVNDFEFSWFDTTTVDLYVVTDTNEDGWPAACDSGDEPLDLWGYTVSLEAFGDPFTLLSIENLVPGARESFPPDVHPYGMTLGYDGGQVLPPGIHHLLRMRLVFEGPYGFANLGFVQTSCHTLPGVGTTLLTACPGTDGDHTLPVWGWGFGFFTDMGNRLASVSAPDSVACREGDSVTFTVDVTDPECGAGTYLFSYFVNGVPEGASASGLSPFSHGEATSSFSWTPAVGQAGVYEVEFVVHDPNPPWAYPYDARATTIVTVAPAVPLSTNFAPTADAGGPYVGAAGEPIRFDGNASTDPEGGALLYAWAFGDGATAAGPSVERAFAESGQYVVSLTVTDEDGLAASDATTASVSAPPTSAPPLIGSVAPNPLTPASEVVFTTTREGSVSIRLYDARGRLVARLVETRSLEAGTHRTRVIGPGAAGTGLGSGTYFLQLRTEHDGVDTRRVTLYR